MLADFRVAIRNPRYSVYALERGLYRIAVLVRHDRPYCMAAEYTPGILRTTGLLLGAGERESAH